MKRPFHLVEDAVVVDRLNETGERIGVDNVLDLRGGAAVGRGVGWYEGWLQRLGARHEERASKRVVREAAEHVGPSVPLGGVKRRPVIDGRGSLHVICGVAMSIVKYFWSLLPR